MTFLDSYLFSHSLNTNKPVFRTYQTVDTIHESVHMERYRRTSHASHLISLQHDHSLIQGLLCSKEENPRPLTEVSFVTLIICYTACPIYAIQSAQYMLISLSTKGTLELICDRGLILQSSGIRTMNGNEIPGNFQMCFESHLLECFRLRIGGRFVNDTLNAFFSSGGGGDPYFLISLSFIFR